jgi:amidohydrolase
MEKMGYRVKRGVGKTGIVAEIGEGGKVVAIRADMDALPILEQNEHEYVSQNTGAMHACGHDSHTAMALGAALLLSKEKLPGRVRFLFQPCEETADEEGKSGAQRMEAEGAMDGVDFVIAQHVDPANPVGTIGINAGPTSGGIDTWYATITGTGGHGAHPDKTVDPFYLLAHVILALNGIVSRRINPFEPAVVSIGLIQGGQTENVIPDRVKINGTLRFTNLEIHQQIREEMKRAFDIAKTLGGGYELRFEYGGPPMINDKMVSDVIEKIGAGMLGVENVHEIKKTLGAEDFGEFLKHAPGAMYTLGTRIEGREIYELHHPKFDIDERAMPIGTALLVETAKRFLAE